MPINKMVEFFSEDAGGAAQASETPPESEQTPPESKDESVAISKADLENINQTVKTLAGRVAKLQSESTPEALKKKLADAGFPLSAEQEQTLDAGESPDATGDKPTFDAYKKVIGKLGLDPNHPDVVEAYANNKDDTLSFAAELGRLAEKHANLPPADETTDVSPSDDSPPPSDQKDISKITDTAQLWNMATKGE